MSAPASCGHSVANAYRRYVPKGDLSRCSKILTQSHRPRVAAATRRVGSKEFAERDVMEYQGGLLRLDIGRANHLGPPLGFVGNKIPKFVGGHRHRLIAQVYQPCLKVEISNAGADFLVELFDNLG